ncbi:flavin reductase family protein [Streptomyces sp. TS71-3]|uniref:flavin reductase family protein n=1 Tax=Streptomyces sp. TS71-3 TaxID=2733862 RepID=UPI001B1A49AA|nr:flavin reductase family protein [Streptomyces sp. TS71-3]GHJ40941.1 oxidoreductase [Streptomyces sp. TS71-3]
MPSSLREVMSRFATGVVVVTVGGEHVHGMTANAFTSVSLDPPLVLCCVAHSAVMHGALSASARFAVSVMAADQERVARHFADKKRPLGAAQFTSVDWRPGPLSGAPLISGALGWLECELTQSHDSGDHTIFIGSVLEAGRGDDAPGLLFHNGAFGSVEGADLAQRRVRTLQ